ncbi:MAG: hypothetical protein KJ077_01055 [Anaerolineae bacterium]|nr:hypothetical protein [Anaerolineae bacterium]
MRIRQQIHSAFLLIILASLACTIRMPEEMARYDTPDRAAPAAVPPTGIPVLTNVITNATILSTPGAEPSPTPAVIAIKSPVPAALAELTVE